MWLRSVVVGLSAAIIAVLAPATATASTSTDSIVYFATPDNVRAPVNKVAANWNLNDKGIVLTRVASCESYYPCATVNVVPVRSISIGGGVFWYDGTHHINLFYWPDVTYNERRMILCHELGHYLGLEHNSHGCMRSYIRASTHNVDPKPYAGDWNRQRIRAPQ